LLPQLSNCIASTFSPHRLGRPMSFKPTPLQQRVKEHGSAVDWRVIR
jgi:hypothetical protein